MKPSVVSVTGDALQALGVSARPRVDARDVVVPDGYRVDVVVVGLSFPTGMGIATDGTIFLLEGGSTWPTRPSLPPRVLRLTPDGHLDALGKEPLGGPRGVAVHDGGLFV